MSRANSQTIIFSKRLFETYQNFYEKRLYQRRFVLADILPLIENLRKHKLFEVSKIGKSVEERDIFQIKLGHGPTKILLWSQMHGNESTATRAIFDILNFFKNQNSGFENEKNEILKNCTLYFIPMLNPDGAERFTRRNALGIDLNRDALALQSPEAILLKKLQNDLQPDFGYNLHDQSPRYAVGNTGIQATIAFLATAYNEAREINPIRKRSMQLIVGMNEVLQQFIPNRVARFSDEFEQRAFGDNIQKWGTTLILVESGGLQGDPEKEQIRKLNFVAILASLLAIAKKGYEAIDIKDYELIPENNRVLFDLLIKGAKVTIGKKTIVADLGINKEEIPSKSGQKLLIKSTLEDLGDLSTFYGVEEIDATGLEYFAEKPLILNQKADFLLKKQNKIIYTIKNGFVKKH